MPDAPIAIFTPPSAPTPSAAGAVHAVPSAAPAAIGAVHAVPVVGGEGGVSVIEQTGHDPIPMTEGAVINGRPSYTGPDSQTLEMFNSFGMKWRYYSPGEDPGGSPSTTYAMHSGNGDVELSAATGWVSVTSGLPIAGFAVSTGTALAAPGAVHASPGIPSPSSPGAVHASPGTPTPSAPGAVHTSPSLASPVAPPSIFTTPPVP